MDSEEVITKNSKKSRSSGSTRSSTKKSNRNSNNSPKRNEPHRRTKKSQGEHKTNDKARAERDSASAIDHTGAVDRIKGRKNKDRASGKGRSQQDQVAKAKALINRSSDANTGPTPGAHASSRGDKVVKDAATKGNIPIDRSSTPNTGPGPMPGAHADSRGDKVVGKKTEKGRFRRRILGTKSVSREERRARLEAEKGGQGDHGNEDGLVTANAIKSTDAEDALELLNEMLDQKQTESGGGTRTKKLDKSLDGSSVASSENGNTQQNDESNAKDWERSKQKKSVRICQFLLCVVVIAGASVGAWLGLGGNDEQSLSNEASQVDGGSLVTENITDAPAIATPPSQNPTTITNPATTSEPSESPSSTIDMDFDPPSTEECDAIANGETIEGQESMPVQRYQLDLDATPFVSMALDFSSSIIEDKIQESLTPVLTGCNRIVRKLRHHRHLNDDAFSYAIANVIVDATGAEGVECLDDSNPACHRVSVKLDLVVKAESVKVVTVIGELSVFFGSGVLAEKLGLTDTYESIIARNLGPIDQTEAPSSSVDGALSPIPTLSPSAAASALLVTPMPSDIRPVEPTSEPTRLPTFAPVVGETPRPTPRPTPVPTAPPTTSLTPRPTPPPTLPPTPGPTSPPTIAPVEPIPNLPTPEPTAPPTPGPTLPPTPGPTLSPTPNPTPQPTSPPTPMPTLSPTPQPTPPPPTPQPTPEPTPPPTPQPVTPAMPCFQTTNELYLAASNWSWQQATVEAEYGPIGDWCFGAGVTSMNSLFSYRSSFNEDIGNWDVSSVTDMYGMFSYAGNFNQDISAWDVSSVTTMGSMFQSASKFNGDISSWDVSSVRSMNGMFGLATDFNQNLSAWKVGSVTDMGAMFDGASSFDQDISEWDVSSVTSMISMFYYATSFNQDISRWGVSSLTTMEAMFYGASTFNQNLCPWGLRLNINTNVDFAPFHDTSCPPPSNPIMSSSPPGPFCQVCA